MMNWKRILSDAAWAAVRACDAAFQAELRTQPPPASDSPEPRPAPSPETASTVPVDPPLAPTPTGSDMFFDRIDDLVTPIYRAMKATPAGREKHAEEVLAWFEGHLGRLAAETHRLLTHRAPALGELDSIKSLAPSVEDHVGRLILEESRSPNPQWHTQILWGLVLAHEQGLRGEVRGNAGEVLAWLEEKKVMDPAVQAGGHGRSLPWLARRSPLITKGGHEPGGAVIWVAHLDWLGAPPANLFPTKAAS